MCYNLINYRLTRSWLLGRRWRNSRLNWKWPRVELVTVRKEMNSLIAEHQPTRPVEKDPKCSTNHVARPTQLREHFKFWKKSLELSLRHQGGTDEELDS